MSRLWVKSGRVHEKSAKLGVYRNHTHRYAHIQLQKKANKRRITKEKWPFAWTIQGDFNDCDADS